MHKITTSTVMLLLAILILFAPVSYAEEDAKPHKVVIQVSSDDPKTHNMALNNAANLQEVYGVENIEIEIVAYGPGLSLMVAAGKQARKLKILAKRGVTLSACKNTMKNIKQKTGEFPALHEDVQIVPAGVARIVKLQEDGYTYIRP